MPDVCTECGARLRQGARFCQVCGTPVVGEKVPEHGRKKPEPSQCLRCGKPLPEGARFCGICGQPTTLSAKEVTKKEPSIPKEPDVKPLSDTPKERPREGAGLHEIPVLSDTDIPLGWDSDMEEPTASIEIPEEMILILYARKRAPEIQTELAAHVEELDSLSEKMDVGLLTKKEAMEQLAELKKKIAELQAEQMQLDEVASVPIEIERLAEELEKITQWEEKLEGLKQAGDVSDAVYKKVRQEYSEKRTIAERQLNAQVLCLKQWADLLKKRANRIAQEQETQKVKLSVEDISSKEAIKHMKESEKELKKIKIAEEQARIILQKFL